MAEFELVKLTVDALLCVSLVYLGVRLLKASPSGVVDRKMVELEESLRGIVRQADGASRELSEELVRRQRAIERLLADAQSTERRIQEQVERVSASASSTVGRSENPPLGRPPAIARQPLAEEIERSVEPTVRRHTPPPAQPYLERTRHLDRRNQLTVPAQAATPRPDSYSYPRSAAVNIYGEPIGRHSTMHSTPEQLPHAYPVVDQKREEPALAQHPGEIESVDARPSPFSAIDRAASELLRAGHDVGAVAAATRLPLDQVRTLAAKVQGAAPRHPAFAAAPRVAQADVRADGESGRRGAISQRETPADQAHFQQVSQEGATDPRLGVLGAIRRQVHTV